MVELWAQEIHGQQIHQGHVDEHARRCGVQVPFNELRDQAVLIVDSCCSETHKSGERDECCCARQGNNLSEESINWRQMQPEMYPTRQVQRTIEKSNQHSI